MTPSQVSTTTRAVVKTGLVASLQKKKTKNNWSHPKLTGYCFEPQRGRFHYLLEGPMSDSKQQHQCFCVGY